MRVVSGMTPRSAEAFGGGNAPRIPSHWMKQDGRGMGRSPDPGPLPEGNAKVARIEVQGT
jgi:hypothetical protein